LRYPYCSTFRVSNPRDKPHVVVVEPWAPDYTLLPGEELEILAFGDTVPPTFEVDESDGVSQVYCNDAADFRVMQHGVELRCGHNRLSDDF
jgi:hypothetical protein